MSDGPPNLPPSATRHGCLSALMVVGGVVLLLPGLCAGLFAADALTRLSWPREIGPLILFGLFCGAAGLWLLIRVSRG
ncbi:Mercuric transport protein (Mercury ion transport protein) (fragment) [Bradyrhizobium sp. ORS 285]